MRKRSRKPKPADPNQMAARIVEEATAFQGAVEEPKEPEKNPAAVALGRLGGKKGGPARAKALSAAKRKAIAKKAASARWRG
ncbi:MAG: hypothetical protein ACT4PV_11880 [Planctomycetaceae bacterium]